jgi:hypothetical protein
MMYEECDTLFASFLLSRKEVKLIQERNRNEELVMCSVSKEYLVLRTC